MTIALRQRPLARVVAGIVRANDGAWFDPSDLSTLYQDAAGTIPVTAVEQPVGLILDKARGLTLGPEIVPDPTFSQWSDPSVPNGWQKTGTHNATNYVQQGAGGGLRIVSDGTLVSVSIPAAIVVGKTYKVTLTTSSAINPSVSVNLDVWEPVRASTVGTFTFIVNGTQTTLDLKRYGPDGACDMTVTYLSVRELYGYHATQSITASRPTLSARKNILLATETLATQSVTTLAATYTLSFTGTGSVTLSGAATGTLMGNGTDGVSLTFTPTAGTLTLTVSGSVTKAQVELGSIAGPYQRVTTATDYDTDERYFPKYLQFSSVVAIDDFLNLPYMGLYNGGAASIVCARDAIPQATDTYIISERSTTDADPKYFPSRQLASGGNMDAYISDDAAAVVLDTVGSAFGGAADKVIRSVVDTGSNLKLYKNGSLAADDNYTRAGTLTLNNTTIGASVSITTSNYASMKLYGLIVTKSALTDVQRIACERHLSRKAGVAL